MTSFAQLRQMAEDSRDAEREFKRLSKFDDEGRIIPSDEWAMAALTAKAARRELGFQHEAILRALNEIDGLDCPTCAGQGSLDGTAPCPACKGSGRREPKNTERTDG